MAVIMELTWEGVTPEQYDEARDKVAWETDLAKGRHRSRRVVR